MIERLDRRLHDPEEAAAILGRPLLGAIAPARGKLRPGELSAKESEAFHMLRANLRYLSIDREIRSIVVTSGAPGDGKTTVAWNLALAAASAGTDVVLVEADLRNPALGARVDLASAGHSGGLSEVLAGEVTLDGVWFISGSDRDRPIWPRDWICCRLAVCHPIQPTSPSPCACRKCSTSSAIDMSW